MPQETGKARGCLSIVAATLVALALAPSGAAASGTGGCDDRTMRGVYAVHWTGTMLGQPLAVVGHVAFKRKRRTSGVLTEVWNGQPSRYTFDSTYSLGANCRGALDFRARRPVPDRRTFSFQTSANGRRASFILKRARVDGLPADEETLANSTIVLSGVGERLSRRRMTCDEESVRGVYAFNATGTTAAGLFTFTFIGEITFDGEGGIFIHSVGTAPHTVDPHVHYKGTYSVDPDCHGDARISGEHFDIRDHHIVELYAAARGKRGFAIFTKSWVQEFLGLPVDPMGINQELAQGNEQEFSYTLSGVAERR